MNATAPTIRLTPAWRRASLPVARARAAWLVAPLLLFMVLGFAWPIGSLLIRSFDDPAAERLLPATTHLLAQWDGEGLPAAQVYQAIADELIQARGSDALNRFAKKLAGIEPAGRTLILKAANQLTPADVAVAATALPALDRRWGERATWQVLRQAVARFSARHLAEAVDLRSHLDGGFSRVPDDEAIYLHALQRTFVISALVTVGTVVLGYPFAYGLVSSGPPVARLWLLALLIPFWTSLLVRTTGWVVLLQEQGLVNKTLIGIGALDAPLKLMFNRFGVVVAMIHVLLPFMVLPIYSAMKSTSHSFLMASASLGATPWTTFRKVYLPLTLPGVVAGGILVFTQALGYFITPALIGGPADQMLGYFISMHANETLNWGLAAALAAILLMATVILFTVYARFAGVDRLGGR